MSLKLTKRARVRAVKACKHQARTAANLKPQLRFVSENKNVHDGDRMYNLPDIVSIRWLNPLMKVGSRRNLELSDIYDVVPGENSEDLLKTAEK